MMYMFKSQVMTKAIMMSMMFWLLKFIINFFYMSFDDFSVSFRGGIDLAPSGLEVNTHVLELCAIVGLMIEIRGEYPISLEAITQTY